MSRSPCLLLGALACALPLESTPAQSAPQVAPQAIDAAEDEIVVVGQRQRGSVIGDVKPEISLNGGDVRALGVTDVTEMLAELAPQLQSTRGGDPLVLLEGHRVSSFREIASIPSEAIVRVEILPEEVALKYGYPADSKVLNIVLRKRFRAFTLDGRERLPTAGGANRTTAGLDFLSIRNGRRLNLSADFTDAARLLESDRGLPDSGRTLLPSDRKFTVGGTYALPLADRLTASFNAEGTTDQGVGLVGLGANGPLARYSSSQNGHLGATLNADGRSWQGTLTATYDRDEGRGITGRDAGFPAEQTRSRADTATLDLTVNTSLYRLPAGQVSLTGRLGGTLQRLESESTRALLPGPAALGRDTGLAALSLDVPVLDSPSRLVGTLSVNGNAEVQRLSDAGTLSTYGGGVNWAPVKAVGLVASFRQQDAAPTIQQLGNPQTLSPAVPVFDYRTNQNVLVRQTGGGNPGLLTAEQRDWRLGLTVKPWSDPDLTFTVDYNKRHIRNAIIALPDATQATEQAFADRFTRDGTGTLVAVDARPVNIARRDSEVIRWGINFTKRLKTPKAQVDAMRAAFEKRFPNGFPGDTRGSDAAHGFPAGGPGAGGFGGFGGGGGGRGGGMRGGRFNLAFYHSWHLTESAVLRDGLPAIDLLNGGTVGQGAVTPRHELELQAGWSRSGLGVRLTGKWQSPSHVVGAGGAAASDLRFSGLGTVDLRLFANVGQLPGLIGKAPWLRGLRVTVGVTNLFDARRRVTDTTGATPFAYQPGFLDPVGRAVTIGIRKQFF